MENEKLHTKALRVFADMKPTQSIERAQNVVRDFNALRREHVENHVRPILIEMQAAFERGETLAGAPSLKQWCRVFKSEGVLSFARCRQIITGKSGNESKAVKSLDPVALKGGMLVSFGGEKFTVAKISVERSSVIHMIVKRVEEPVESEVVAAPEKLTSTKSRKSLCAQCGKRKPRKATLCDACKNPEWTASEKARKVAKVHAIEPNDKKRTRCRKNVNEYPTASDDQVTCGLCQTSLASQARAEAWYAEHPEERGWMMWDNLHWRNQDGRRMTKTPHKKEYKTFDKDGTSLGVVATWEEACALKHTHPATKALAAAEKANLRSKGTSAKPVATSAKTELVKLARIGNTNEFGVFPESCWKCTTDNALRIGTRQECEAERDRINAKRLAKNDSVENLVAHGDAHQNQQQHPAAEALEKALDSTEPVEVSDEQHDEEQCDYSEEQVVPMFAQGSELPEL